MRGKRQLSRKKMRIRPFRVLAVGLTVMAVQMAIQLPNKAISAEHQQEQLEAAADAYYDAQSRNNALRMELSEINTADFIERTARREYGYCWYGEVIYEVGNLEQIEPESDIEIYGQD